MQPKYPKALLEALQRARQQGPIDIIVYNRHAKFIPMFNKNIGPKFVPTKFGTR